eukprot:4491943-Alexandrium_andersonii.AAC.1
MKPRRTLSRAATSPDNLPVRSRIQRVCGARAPRPRLRTCPPLCGSARCLQLDVGVALHPDRPCTSGQQGCVARYLRRRGLQRSLRRGDVGPRA